MTTIITGANGFIGKSIKDHLLTKKKEEKIVEFNKYHYKKKLFNKIFSNNKIVKIIHCANIYKGKKKDIFKTNLDLPKKILNFSSKKKIIFYYFNTIHNKKKIEKNIDNYFYVKSKNIFLKHCKKYVNKKKNNLSFISIKIPTVFGFNSLNRDFCSYLITNLKKNHKVTIKKPNLIRKIIYIKKFLLKFDKIFKRKKFSKKYNNFFIKEQLILKTNELAYLLKNYIKSKSKLYPNFNIPKKIFKKKSIKFSAIIN